MSPADAEALAVLARASRAVAVEGVALPLDAEEAHLVRALEALRLVEVRGDRVVATHQARQRLEAVRVLLLDGLGGALRATRSPAA